MLVYFTDCVLVNSFWKAWPVSLHVFFGYKASERKGTHQTDPDKGSQQEVGKYLDQV